MENRRRRDLHQQKIPLGVLEVMTSGHRTTLQDLMAKVIKLSNFGSIAFTDTCKLKLAELFTSSEMDYWSELKGKEQ